MLNFSGDVFKIINEKRGQTRSSFGKCGQTRSSSGGGQITRLYQNLCTIPESYKKSTKTDSDRHSWLCHQHIHPGRALYISKVSYFL